MANVRLMDQVRGVIRALHYSRSTEHAYCYWIRFYIKFHRRRHPKTLGAREVSEFLTWLAVKRKVSAATQNQALNAIVFLYRKVLHMELDNFENIIRAKRSRRIPVVFSRSEVAAILSGMSQPYKLMCSLMYGSGLRVMETLRLRLKDIDQERLVILVRAGKGNKDRVTVLPDKLIPDIEAAIQRTRALHAQDLAEGFGEVSMPYALDRKYPNQAKGDAWQFLFAANHRSIDPVSKREKRHHIFETTPRRALRAAMQKAGLPSQDRATLSDIPLPRICWKMVMIFVRCRIYSVTRM